MYIIKRNGEKQEYNSDKIIKAVEKADISVNGGKTITNYQLFSLLDIPKDRDISVEEIQDKVEIALMKINPYVAKAFILYREKHKLIRESNTTDLTIKELLNGGSDYWNNENSNKNAKLVTVQRDYIAGITSTDISRRFLIDKDIIEAHDEGIIHFHDLDYFAQNAIHNCCLINLEDILQNGTVINGVMIEKPHKFITACTIATQVITAVASSQYGGCTISLTHLAPFVRSSFEKYKNKYISWGVSDKEATNWALKDTLKEVSDGVQTFNYQVNSMTTTNGQSPFLSVNMYLGETSEYKEELAMIIEEFLNQRILGFKNEKGVYITPAFPKLLYVLEEDNIRPDSKYWYLTELAAKCTAKRLVPDYISEKVMKELKQGDCYPCMGCRSFLTPSKEHKYYSRFNQGVVTINLADVALSSYKDLDKFWKLLDERLELCHRALQIRHNRLLNIKSDVAPILWQYGALGRLPKGEVINELLFNGNSTISLGYAALYECTKYMTGHSHSKEGKEFALSVMQKLNDKCNEWKLAEHIDYSVYGTPIESTTYKFAKCLQKRFGIIPGITDRKYITNSYHIPVFEEIDAFDKLSIEKDFQKLSPGGAISYIEACNLVNNIPAVLEVIKYIYDNIMYAEINVKSDYCQVCGFDGEFKIDDDLEWYCPNCGNRDHSKMNVARRTCGYIGSNFWNKGRTQEIKERVVHLDNKDYEV